MRVTNDELEKILAGGQVSIRPSSIKNINGEETASRSPSSLKSIKNIKGECESPFLIENTFNRKYPREASSSNPSKYWNIKTEANGILFDSKKEADRYLELLLLIKSKNIYLLKLQERFNLLNAFTTIEGKRINAITYTPDFTYFDTETNRKVIEDVKNEHTATQQFKIKWKLMQEQYPQFKYILI